MGPSGGQDLGQQVSKQHKTTTLTYGTLDPHNILSTISPYCALASMLRLLLGEADTTNHEASLYMDILS